MTWTESVAQCYVEVIHLHISSFQEQEQLMNSKLETEMNQDFEVDELLSQQSDSASAAKSESQDFNDFI